MKKYGLPYKGSKSRLADKILALLPNADTFVDLFAGGCAMTHAALVSKRYKQVIANDISDIPQVFLNALEGKYENEDRWISREDFFRLKDSDPYVRLVWSFGNNCQEYIYGDVVLPIKKALHWAVYYGDPQPLKDFGVDVSELMNIENKHKRWLAVKRKCQQVGITTSKRRLLEGEGDADVELQSSGALRTIRNLKDMVPGNRDNECRLQHCTAAQCIDETMRVDLENKQRQDVIGSISANYPPPNLSYCKATIRPWRYRRMRWSMPTRPIKGQVHIAKAALTMNASTNGCDKPTSRSTSANIVCPMILSASRNTSIPAASAKLRPTKSQSGFSCMKDLKTTYNVNHYK